MIGLSPDAILLITEHADASKDVLKIGGVFVGGPGTSMRENYYTSE